MYTVNAVTGKHKFTLYETVACASDSIDTFINKDVCTLHCK